MPAWISASAGFDRRKSGGSHRKATSAPDARSRQRHNSPIELDPSTAKTS